MYFFNVPSYKRVSIPSMFEQMKYQMKVCDRLAAFDMQSIVHTKFRVLFLPHIMIMIGPKAVWDGQIFSL